MPERIKNLSRENLRLLRADVVFGDVEYNPGGTCGPRTQRDYQLVIVSEGSLELFLDGAPLAIGRGQATLLSPRHREHFRFAADVKTRHSWCAIRPRAVPLVLRRAMHTAARPLVWTAHLQQLFELGRECGGFVAHDQTLEAQRFLHLALLLLAEFLVEARRQSGGISDQRVEKMRRMIAREYRRSLSLADLARAAGLSKQHLGMLCRRAGLPAPLAQLYQQRLASAADLLLHTGLSIKQISEQCGFKTQYHFSRKFKQWSRLTPRAYRQRIQLQISRSSG